MQNVNSMTSGSFASGTIPASGEIILSMRGAPKPATITIFGTATATMGALYDTTGEKLNFFSDSPIYTGPDNMVFECKLTVAFVKLVGPAGARFTVL